MDFLLPSFLKRLLLAFIFIGNITRAFIVGDSNKFSALVSCTAVTVASFSPDRAALSMFLGFKLALKDVVITAMESTSYRVTDEENLIDVLLRPIPVLVNVCSCLVMHNIGIVWLFFSHLVLDTVIVLLATWVVYSVGFKGNALSQIRPNIIRVQKS